MIRITGVSSEALANLFYDEYGVPAITGQGRFQYTGLAARARHGLLQGQDVLAHARPLHAN